MRVCDKRAMQMNCNRRDFRKGVTLAAVAGGVRTSKGEDVATMLKATPWLDAEVVVAGGGPAGVCAAVSAARMGAKTILV